MSEKILFIEDESALQETFGDLLTGEGYEVIRALDGQSGLRLAKSEKPNLILLDLILPKMNGFEVLEGIKKDDEAKDIPVIILTNLESAGDVQKAIEFGAKDYLVKANYKMKEVLEKIKSALK
jgi:two-component system, OmpR family, alkaline phosphatase synthesis response regulator PhoP